MFDVDDRVDLILRFVVFGHKKFKGKQKEIIEAAYTGVLNF